MSKTWTDQPDELEDAPEIAYIRLADAQGAEIRSHPTAGYYVTIGNLWKSQTLLCPLAVQAFVVIGLVSSKGSAPIKAPDGVTVFPSKEEASA